MISYIDSSVLLRLILTSPDPLPEWLKIQRFVSSALLHVECARAIHRLRAIEPLTDEQFARALETLTTGLGDIQLVGLDSIVLDRASGSFSFPLKTLDAIHLATAMLWREREDPGLAFATHDRQLGLAARAAGFRVLGL